MPTFTQGGYVYVGEVHAEWEIDYDEALDEIGEDFVQEWLDERRGTARAKSDVAAALEDPAKRLEVITWLRGNGWSVEPA